MATPDKEDTGMNYQREAKARSTLPCNPIPMRPARDIDYAISSRIVPPTQSGSFLNAISIA